MSDYIILRDIFLIYYHSHLEAPANPVLGIGYEEPERLEQFKKLTAAAKVGGSGEYYLHYAY